jgi:hypothetical protein
MSVRDRQRHRDRALALREHRQAYERAREELAHIHDTGGRFRSSYLVRRTLLRARTPGAEDPVVASPAAALAPLKGWALHLYLIGLFDTQARRPAGWGFDTTRPLLQGRGRLAPWVDLLPAVTATRARSAGMRRQLVRALGLLEREKLAALKGWGGRRGRYDNFLLLNEVGTSYTIPSAGEPAPPDPAWIRSPGPVRGRTAVLNLPPAFFVNGWAHVLSAAEITTYLMLCDLEARYPEAKGGGVYAIDRHRETSYGIRRDVYASHRQLSAYGLVERLEAPNRRTDGTITQRPGRGQVLQPYRFRTLPQGFDRAARPAVADALDHLADS